MTRLLVCGAALFALTACHRNADLLDVEAPVLHSVLALRTDVQGDTTRVAITLSEGSTKSVGSLTADVMNPAGYTFTGCAAGQGEALLACKAHGATVKVAGAWVAGTHAGSLIVLTYLGNGTADAGSTGNGWTLVVTEAHGARGQSLLDSLVVRRDGGTP
jgi:hypothetical protein